MAWMVLVVANMVSRKDGLGHDRRRERGGTKRGHKDDKEFAVGCETRRPVYHIEGISS